MVGPFRFTVRQAESKHVSCGPERRGVWAIPHNMWYALHVKDTMGAISDAKQIAKYVLEGTCSIDETRYK